MVFRHYSQFGVLVLLWRTYRLLAMDVPDFPLAIYGNVYQGACVIHDQSELENKRQIALGNSLQEAARVEEKELLGWIRALVHARRDLGSKPIQEWSLSDLDGVNAQINYFVRPTTSSVRRRSDDIFWFVQPITEGEESVFKLSERDFNRCSHEPWIQRIVNSLQSKMHFFPPADSIEQRMSTLFAHLKKSEQQQHDPLISAATLHTGIISIHPFEHGNKRTARIVSNLYLMRHDMGALCYNDNMCFRDEELIDPYLDALCIDLQQGTSENLRCYMSDKLKEQHLGVPNLERQSPQE